MEICQHCGKMNTPPPRAPHVHGGLGQVHFVAHQGNRRAEVDVEASSVDLDSAVFCYGLQSHLRGKLAEVGGVGVVKFWREDSESKIRSPFPWKPWATSEAPFDFSVSEDAPGEGEAPKKKRGRKAAEESQEAPSEVPPVEDALSEQEAPAETEPTEPAPEE